MSEATNPPDNLTPVASQQNAGAQEKITVQEISTQKNQGLPTAEDLPHLLASDLTWLEQYARERESLHGAVVPLRLAAALLRNKVGPYLSRRETASMGTLLHLAVVGGAGTGKSTVVNFLIGRAVAEANPQAGFTRHPVAYVPVGSNHVSQLTNGILGQLQAIPGPAPSDRDQDVFQVRQIQGLPEAASELSLLTRAVIWDCPDMTTWKANQYQTRLVETLGLADLVIYVASDERYNDAWPTQYLQYLLQAGKPVVACLTKMQPSQQETLLKHFRETVISRIPECAGVSAVVALPHLSAAEQADPGGVGNGIRQPLVQAVEWWLRNPSRTRSDGVERAIRFLTQFQETLLAPAREELSAVSLWETWVTEGAKTYADRYQNEHLTGEQFPHFQAAMVRLMELLELPGVGQYVSKAMHLLRSPYRWVKSWLSKPTSQTQVETQVLQAGFQGWLDRLRHHLLQQDREQTVWNTLYQAYQQQADQALLGAFEQRVAEFSKKQSVEVEATARSIYEELEKNPSALNTLRGLKFSVEAASLTGVVLTAGTHLLLYPLLLPLVASVTHAVTEGLGKQYVDSQREKSRNRLLHLFGDTVVQPMEKELKQWPEKLLPDLPRLREITSRLPAHLASLQKQLQAMPRREVA